MKVMLTITGPFEGGDPSGAEMRTMTIGTRDPAELADDVARWAHFVVTRMLRGDAPPEPEDPPMPVLEVTDLPIAIWEDLTDAA